MWANVFTCHYLCLLHVTWIVKWNEKCASTVVHSCASGLCSACFPSADCRWCRDHCPCSAWQAVYVGPAVNQRPSYWRTMSTCLRRSSSNCLSITRGWCFAVVHFQVNLHHNTVEWSRPIPMSSHTVSSLSVLSQLLERLTGRQLPDYLTSSKLVPRIRAECLPNSPFDRDGSLCCLQVSYGISGTMCT